MDLAVLAAVVDEAAHRVGERDPGRTAAALLTEARRAGVANPERALAIAYDRGTAEAVDEAEARSGQLGCRPVRDQAALAFVIARRELRGEGPPPWPPWPERRPRRVMPPASPPAAEARPPRVSARRGAGSAQEARTGPALADLSPAEETATWEALSADERKRAEAAARRTYPDLAEHTHERGNIWRLTVLGAVHRPGRTSSMAEPGNEEE